MLTGRFEGVLFSVLLLWHADDTYFIEVIVTEFMGESLTFSFRAV